MRARAPGLTGRPRTSETMSEESPGMRRLERNSFDTVGRTRLEGNAGRRGPEEGLDRFAEARSIRFSAVGQHQEEVPCGEQF